jgi:hypothetical protein
MKVKVNYGFLIALCLTAASVWGDSLELKNGSLIKGRFVGGTETEIQPPGRLLRAEVQRRRHRFSQV